MSEFSDFRKIAFASTLNTSSFLSGLPIKTNIIHRNGINPVSTYGGAKSGLIQLPSDEIPDFFSIVEECRQYRHLDLTKNLLKLLTTDIKNLIDDSRPICEIANHEPKVTVRANRILNRHGVRSKVKESIADIVYYGSISYMMKLGKLRDKKQLFFYDLEDPYSVVIRESKGKTTYILPGTTDMEISKDNIIYMGSKDFKLQALDSDYVPLISQSSSSKEYIIPHNDLQLRASEAVYHASEPLFYSITQKIKQYYIKDLLETILSVRDAIQPTILTLNEEITRNGGDTSAFNNAATNLESLINRLSDTSITIAEILDIDTLVNAVFSSIKVLPDPGGTLQNLNNLNLESFTEKLNRLKDGLDDLKKEIQEALGIPPDLWDGSSNSNEVYQKNERLKDLVFEKLQTVKSATRHFIYTILSQVAPELNISEDDIILKMFRKSAVEYARDQKEITALKEDLSLVSETLSAASEIIDGNRFIQKDKFYAFLHENLVNIAPDYAELIKDKKDVVFETEDAEDDDKDDY